MEKLEAIVKRQKELIGLLEGLERIKPEKGTIFPNQKVLDEFKDQVFAMCVIDMVSRMKNSL